VDSLLLLLVANAADPTIPTVGQNFTALWKVCPDSTKNVKRRCGLIEKLQAFRVNPAFVKSAAPLAAVTLRTRANGEFVQSEETSAKL
jgi:hypothetical protein